jgi:hypothetical protein
MHDILTHTSIIQPETQVKPALSFLGGKPPNPQGRLRRGLDSPWSSAKQNKRFLLLFLEKEEDKSTNSFLGGTPPNPQGRLRRGLGCVVFCEAELRFLLLFLEKEDILRRIPFLEEGFQTNWPAKQNSTFGKEESLKSMELSYIFLRQAPNLKDSRLFRDGETGQRMLPLPEGKNTMRELKRYIVSMHAFEFFLANGHATTSLNFNFLALTYHY